MRKRIARKIYYPSDVGLAYRQTTYSRAFHRLRLGDHAKWRRWGDWVESVWSRNRKRKEHANRLRELTRTRRPAPGAFWATRFRHLQRP